MGHGGHAATWQAALALVRGFALEGDVALDLLVHEYNPRCDPPWWEEELRRKIDGAQRSTNQPGYLLERPGKFKEAFRAFLDQLE